MSRTSLLTNGNEAPTSAKTGDPRPHSHHNDRGGTPPPLLLPRSATGRQPKQRLITGNSGCPSLTENHLSHQKSGRPQSECKIAISRCPHCDDTDVKTIWQSFKTSVIKMHQWAIIDVLEINKNMKVSTMDHFQHRNRRYEKESNGCFRMFRKYNNQNEKLSGWAHGMEGTEGGITELSNKTKEISHCEH